MRKNHYKRSNKPWDNIVKNDRNKSNKEFYEKKTGYKKYSRLLFK